MLSHERMQFKNGLAEAQEPSGLLDDHSVELEILRGRAQRRLRPVSVPAYLMGRAEDCDLVLADARFPEAFAYILVRGRQLLLRHLGFAPSLMLNGQTVTQAPLNDGDILETEGYTFRLHVRPKENGSREGSRQTAGALTIRPETRHALAHTEALAEALDLIRCIRREVLGDQAAFRLYLGPEEHLASFAGLATLPVGSAAFRSGGSHEARSA